MCQSVAIGGTQTIDVHYVHREHGDAKRQTRNVRDSITDVLDIHHMLSSYLSIGLQGPVSMATGHIRCSIS